MENTRNVLKPESLAGVLTRISDLQGSGRVCKASTDPPMADTSPLSQKEGAENQSEHNVAVLTALLIPSGILKSTRLLIFPLLPSAKLRPMLIITYCLHLSQLQETWIISNFWK